MEKKEPEMTYLSARDKIPVINKIKRRNTQISLLRASSLMEVLVALLVFSLVLATTFKIIGMGRSLSLINNERQRSMDAADNLLTQVSAGSLFWQAIFTTSERQSIRDILNKLYGRELPQQLDNFAVLQPIFSQNSKQKIYSIRLDYAKAPVLYIERRTVSTVPWLIHVSVFIDDEKKPNQLLIETYFSEALMRPVLLKSL